MSDTGQTTSAGIEALIARLREEGVDEGKSAADRILAEAEQRASDLIDRARKEAEQTRNAAEKEAEKLRLGGEQALQVAMRDSVLELKQTLSGQFANEVRGTVSEQTRDEEFLQKMILAVAGRARGEAAIDEAENLDVYLPRSVIGLDDLRRKPEELREGSLSHFAAVAAKDMLRGGVTFFRAEGDDGGIRVKLADEGIELDLTDRAVADVILRHLQPRFRAMLEGVVK